MYRLCEATALREATYEVNEVRVELRCLKAVHREIKDQYIVRI